jgi:hypothetical protein
MVFVRNIIVSGDYIRRGKVKKKTLFHVLFLSQILAPITFIPNIMSYFTQRLNCTVVIILSCVSASSSLALLITVILGVKVYRCLNNARFVPVVLALFQAASTITVAFDVTKTQGIRRLTGSCIPNDDLRFTRYFVIIQFLESLFLCCCFIYVCWKSRGSPAARGRISIELSMDDLPIDIPNDGSEKSRPARRGWWDYVPDNDASGQQKTATSEELKNGTEGTFKTVLQRITGSGDRQQQQPSLKHKNSRLQKRETSNPLGDGNVESSRQSLAPSSMSRFSRLVPRMELFQQVMKDELLYTTFITSTCVVVAVLAMIGVNFKNGLSVTGWIVLNWGIISLLAIHSFGRVVHRHERDAILQHPATCTAVIRAANNIARKDQQNRRRRGFPSSGPPPRARIASTSDETSLNDPFDDSQALEQENPFHSPLDDQDSSSVPSLHLRLSEASSTIQRSYGERPPKDLDFPTSNLSTPAVPVSSAEFARQQRFSRSWIVSPNPNSNYSQSWKSFREDAET